MGPKKILVLDLRSQSSPHNSTNELGGAGSGAPSSAPFPWCRGERGRGRGVEGEERGSRKEVDRNHRGIRGESEGNHRGIRGESERNKRGIREASERNQRGIGIR
jgi:hypothetical protein